MPVENRTPIYRVVREEADGTPVLARVEPGPPLNVTVHGGERFVVNHFRTCQKAEQFSKMNAEPVISQGSTFRLSIPLKPPGKNDLRPDPRVTYIGRPPRPMPSAYLRWKGIERSWRRELPPPTPEQRAVGRRSLCFVRLMTPHERRMDRWNLEGGLNLVVVDQLVVLGWLIDDDESCVEMLPAVQRLAGPGEVAPSTYVEIEDLPGPALRSPLLPGA